MQSSAATTVWTRIARPSSRARSTRPSCRSSTSLPGFKGYYLIDAGNGVFTSLGLFETPEQGMESTKLVATWIREEKLETILPNEPKITSGNIVARSSDRVLAAA